MKYGLVFDSTCGLTKEEAYKKEIDFIPLTISINGVNKRAGVEIFSEDLFKIMTKDTKISTSLPIASDAIEVLSRMLKKYDEVIFIGISTKFSGTINSIRQVVEDTPEFKGKVHIYNSLWSSPWINMYLEDIVNLNKKISNYKEMYKFLDELEPNLIGWLSPKNLIWFYRGGRLSKAQYIAGSLFKITPILTIKNGEIDKAGIMKSFSTSKAMIKIIDNFRPIYNKLEYMGKKIKLCSLYGGDMSLTNKFKEIISKEFKRKIEDIMLVDISPEQVCHMGPGAFGLTYKIII